MMIAKNVFLVSLCMCLVVVIPSLCVSCDLLGSSTDGTEQANDNETDGETQDDGSGSTDSNEQTTDDGTTDPSSSIQLPEIKGSYYSVLYRSTPESQTSGGIVLANVEGELTEASTSGTTTGETNARQVDDQGEDDQGEDEDGNDDDWIMDYQSQYLWTGDDGLDRSAVLDGFVENVEIEEFKISADVFLHSSSETGCATILYWGGDPRAVPMVDLLSGSFESNVDYPNLKPLLYETVDFTLNTAGPCVTPAGHESLELKEVVPFMLDTSNACIFMSTFVDEPFITYLESQDPAADGFDPNDYQTLIDAGLTDEVSNPGEWVGRAPLTEEFFQAARDFVTADPGPGVEPYIFLPLYEPIDLTAYEAGDKIAFSLEVFLKDLLGEYTHEHDSYYWDGNQFFFLSPFNQYADEDGRVYYGPFPFAMLYAENENGVEISE